MNATLIANWNGVVQTNDTVYHLGDFAFTYGGGQKAVRAIEELLDQLNGRVVLIIGNHDKRNIVKRVKKFESVHEELILRHNKQKVVLNHYWMGTWEGRRQGSWHLFGHSHGRTVRKNALAFDVGVDVWDYRPISFAQVKEAMDNKVFGIEPNDPKPDWTVENIIRYVRWGDL